MHGKRDVLIMAAAAGLLLFMCAFVSSGQILPDAANCYYQEEQPEAFSFSFERYGACVALSSVTALCVFALLERRQGRKVDTAFILLALLSGLFFSRLFYVLANIVFYAECAGFIAALRLHEGGMSLSGALFGFFLAERAVYRKQDGPVSSMAVSACVFVLLERLSEHFGHTGFGRDSGAEAESLFYMADGWGYVLRIYVIEAIVAAAILVCLLIFRKSKMGQTDGQRQLALFLILYGFTQVVMESLRADRHMVLGFVKIQMFTSFLPAAGITVYNAWKRRRSCLPVILCVLYAGAVFFLEKALDRGWIPLEEQVYLCYVVLTAAAVILSLRTVNKKEECTA